MARETPSSQVLPYSTRAAGDTGGPIGEAGLTIEDDQITRTTVLYGGIVVETGIFITGANTSYRDESVYTLYTVSETIAYGAKGSTGLAGSYWIGGCVEVFSRVADLAGGGRWDGIGITGITTGNDGSTS